MKAGATFREAFCARYKCTAEEYALRVLWRTHHRRSLPLGRLIWGYNPGLYDADLEMIAAVADCQTAAELAAEVSDFRYHHHSLGFWRKVLHVRVSGQRLVNLGAKLLD